MLRRVMPTNANGMTADQRLRKHEPAEEVKLSPLHIAMSMEGNPEGLHDQQVLVGFDEERRLQISSR